MLLYTGESLLLNRFKVAHLSIVGISACLEKPDIGCHGFLERELSCNCEETVIPEVRSHISDDRDLCEYVVGGL